MPLDIYFGSIARSCPRRIRQDGTLGSSSVIAKTDISRSSGFPRMARLNDEVHFAWTEFGKPSHVRTAVTNVGLINEGQVECLGR